MKIRKLVTAVFLVVTLICVNVTVVTSATPRVIKVGYPLQYGFTQKDENGKYNGFIYDYLQEIAKYTGWEYEFVEGTQSEIREKFIAGEISLWGGIADNEQTREIALFPEFSCGTVNTVLNVRIDNTEISDVQYLQHNTPVIGIWNNSDGLQHHLTQFAQDNAFTYIPKYYNSLKSLKDGLESGEVDIILTDDINKISANQRSIAKFSAMPLYIVTPKGNSEILHELNVALDNINTVYPSFNTKLSKKHFTDLSAATLVLSQTERDYIDQRKVHTVVTNPDARPIQYFSEDGEFKGITANVLNYIARKTGLVFSYKETASIEETLELIDSGQADIATVFNVNSDFNGQADIVKTSQYLPVNIGLIKRADNQLTNTSTVAVIPTLKYLVKGKERYTTEYSTTAECIEAVNKGEIDYTYSSSYIAEYLTQKNRYANVYFVPLSDTDNGVCLGIAQPSDPALLTIINKAITSISKEDLQTMILQNTIIMDKQISLRAYFQSNTMALLLIIGSIFLVLIALIIFIFIVRAKSNRKMYTMANIDAITGAMTFSRFKKQAASIIKTSHLQHALISFDISKFKIINDLFGHKRGDEILKRISTILEDSIGDGEVFTRITADNFNILIEYRSDGGVVGRILNINKRISTCFDGYHIDAAFGIYRIPQGDIDEIVTMSDCANLAKLSIKGKPNTLYAFYDEKVRNTILREKEIENLMEDALFSSEFKLFLQPKYSFIDETIIGAEALVRWDNSEKGMIYPNDFIPLFEKNGFIQRLDLYMFEKVCTFLKSFNEQEIPYVSVNFSRVHLNNLNLANELTAITKKIDIEPKYIEVELTESAIFDNEDRMIKVMNDLKMAGFTLSIDDFGSGYSSLSALKNLPADVIKFDRGFLLESTISERGKDIIKYLVQMSRSLNLTTVAEGVETVDQVDFLKEVGCDIAQGYYYAKPMPATEFASLYKKQLFD